MASDLQFVEYVCDQIGDSSTISFKKMFGEFALYSNGKVVALVCDNQLFVKPTEAGRQLLGTPKEEPPYEGAKPHFLIDEHLDNPAVLAALIAATELELPVPVPKVAAKAIAAAKPKTTAAKKSATAKKAKV